MSESGLPRYHVSAAESKPSLDWSFASILQYKTNTNQISPRLAVLLVHRT